MKTLGMTPKKLADYVDGLMDKNQSNNISLCLGKLPQKTVAYLNKRFKRIESHGVFGYCEFEREERKDESVA